MQHVRILMMVLSGAMVLSACAAFDRKFEQALFGSEEELQAVKKKIAEDKKKGEMKKREDLEEELFDLICQARKKRWLPCDSPDWSLHARAREDAAAVTAHCASLPSGSRYAADDAALGVAPEDARGGREIFICRVNSPRVVMDAWGSDIRTHDILWDAKMRTFAVAVHRNGNGAYSWVLLVKD